MGFTKKQIVYDRWFEVDTAQGIWFIPQDLIGKIMHPKKSDLLDYTECHDVDDIYSVRVIDGYGARMSAPGYLDCTEWTVFDTEEDANNYLDEYYGEDD